MFRCGTRRGGSIRFTIAYLISVRGVFREVVETVFARSAAVGWTNEPDDGTCDTHATGLIRRYSRGRKRYRQINI